MRTIAVLVAGGLLAAGCRGEAIPNGSWGGDHVVLTVKDGGGSVEFDCAHGTLGHELKVDDQGVFSVPGTYVPEHGGPVREGEILPVHTARYQGRVDRQTIEFTVTIEGESAQGPYTVTLAKPPKIEKCL